MDVCVIMLGLVALCVTVTFVILLLGVRVGMGERLLATIEN